MAMIITLMIKNVIVAMIIMTIITTSIMGEASLGGTKVHPAVQLVTATSTGTMSRCIPAYPANMHISVLKIHILLSWHVFLMLTSILYMVFIFFITYQHILLIWIYSFWKYAILSWHVFVMLGPILISTSIWHSLRWCRSAKFWRLVGCIKTGSS